MSTFVKSRQDLGGMTRPFKKLNPENQFCMILFQVIRVAKEIFCFALIVYLKARGPQPV